MSPLALTQPPMSLLILLMPRPAVPAASKVGRSRGGGTHARDRRDLSGRVCLLRRAALALLGEAPCGRRRWGWLKTHEQLSSRAWTAGARAPAHLRAAALKRSRRHVRAHAQNAVKKAHTLLDAPRMRARHGEASQPVVCERGMSKNRRSQGAAEKTSLVACASMAWSVLSYSPAAGPAGRDLLARRQGAQRLLSSSSSPS